MKKVQRVNAHYNPEWSRWGAGGIRSGLLQTQRAVNDLEGTPVNVQKPTKRFLFLLNQTSCI